MNTEIDTSTPQDAVATFYEAIEARDVTRLMATLHQEFVGQISEGLPGGHGGIHRGPEAMLRDCWVPIALAFDAAPHPSDRMETADGRTVVTGVYRGTSPGTGGEFSAAFAHIFSLRSDLIVHLHQITDTRKWPSIEDTGEPVAAPTTPEPVRS